MSRPRSSHDRSPYIVRADEDVARVLDALRGREWEAYDRLTGELAAQGCRAGGYRLLDVDGGWSGFCCRHGYASQRFILTFLVSTDTDSVFPTSSTKSALSF